MFRFLILLCLSPTLLLAQDMQARDSDTRFDQPTLDTVVRGKVLTFFDDGESRFFEDGRYTYTYADDGATGYGYFTVQDDSTICISFVTGFSRCDLYVTDAQGRLTVITEHGDRFPTRP